jgi:Family of unknown function (DUF6338)
VLPSTWLGVVLFLVLIGPGALFDLLEDRRRAQPKETALREASRIVLASLCFSGLGLAAVAVAGAVDARWAPDLGVLLRDPRGYVLDHYPLLIWTAVAEFLVACAAAVGVHCFLHWRQQTSMRTVSLWHAAFREDAPKGFLPYARVRLTSGATWTGYVAHASTDLELGDREIVLSPRCGASSRTMLRWRWSRRSGAVSSSRAASSRASRSRTGPGPSPAPEEVRKPRLR